MSGRGLNRSDEWLAGYIARTVNPDRTEKNTRTPKILQTDSAKRTNKFGAIKTDGSDSRKESRRLQDLRLLQRAGKIAFLIPHVRFRLLPMQLKADGTRERGVNYTCDALYVENGKLTIEDTKSEPTRQKRDYVIARKLMLQLYGVTIRET